MNPIPILVILATIISFFFCIVIFNQLRDKFGYGPLYVFVGVTICFINIISASGITLVISEGVLWDINHSIFVGIIATALLIYLQDGLREAQNMILSIIIGTCFVFIYIFYEGFTLNLDPTNIYLGNKDLLTIFDTSHIISLASIIALTIDLIFVIIIFQFLINRLTTKDSLNMSNYKVQLIGYATLLAVSIVDTISFPIIANSLGINLSASIYDRIIQYTIISTIYAILISIYINKFLSEKHLESRPIFTIATRKKQKVPVELFLAEKRRAEILFNIMGHDMKNNLQLFSASLEMLKLQNLNSKNSKLIKSLNSVYDRTVVITNSISNIGNLTNYDDLLISSKKMDLQKSIQTITKELQLKNSKTNITLIDEYNQSIMIRCNPLLSKAISSICYNAIQNSDPENAEVKISLSLIKEKRNYSAVIYISDTGPGISKELKAILLNPLENINIRTGLGYVMLKLALDFSGARYDIIDRLKYDSKEGTTVKIVIPIM